MTYLEADDQMSNRAGFVLDPDVPLVLLLENVADYQKVLLSLTRVGCRVLRSKGFHKGL